MRPSMMTLVSRSAGRGPVVGRPSTLDPAGAAPRVSAPAGPRGATRDSQQPATGAWPCGINGGPRLSQTQAPFTIQEAVQYLRSRGVRYIAVHGSFYEDPKEFDGIQFVLERRPDIERVATARFNGSISKLYRLR